ncbi:alpha/beta fold hydrolase, partial [Fulvivirga sp. RKSG066]|uniref:homoserine O-acetyltransferase family protein n=1 Tax=Fulvivirga aurantia TaxID=2529383 RepID=UPI0012BBE1AE
MPLTQSKHPIQPLSDTSLFNYDQQFGLECGDTLHKLEIVYTTHGKLNASGDNVIWVFHGLTANANPLDWWGELIGPQKWLDTEQYYVVCANILGSCYGTTGPASINPITGKAYGINFPHITIRDMVKAHQLVQQHLGIEKIHLGIGGSLGGQQLLEWAVTDTHRFEYICPIATNARHSAWGIAFNETQRMALEASNFNGQGLEVARAVAMLSYRHQNTYRKTQTDFDDKIDDFKASSYQRYQGQKLNKRFDPFAYYYLSKAMDSHNIGRNRKSVRHALRSIKAEALCIGL